MNTTTFTDTNADLTAGERILSASRRISPLRNPSDIPAVAAAAFVTESLVEATWRLEDVAAEASEIAWEHFTAARGDHKRAIRSLQAVARTCRDDHDHRGDSVYSQAAQIIGRMP